MNQRLRRLIVQELVMLAKSSVDVTIEGTRLNMTIGTGPSAYRLLDADVEAYNHLVSQMLTDTDWHLKFSERTISIEVNRIIGLLRPLPSQSDAERLLDEVARKMDAYATVNRAYLPLAGIEITFLPIDIGNVTITGMTRSAVDEAVASALQIIERPGDNGAEIERPDRRWENMVRDGLEGKVCAVFEAVAEPDRIIERTEDEARRAVDLLMFASSALYPPGQVGISLEGELLSGTRRTVVAGPTPESEFTSAGRRVGPIEKFSFTPDNVDRMRSMGIFQLSEILRRQSASDLEEALMRAIHWFASSQLQPELAHQLLSLVTCLESLLAPESGAPISASVAEAAAFVLAGDFETRQIVKHLVRRMYDARSRISHGGTKPVSVDDINELRIICGGILVEVTRLTEEDHGKPTPELLTRKDLRSVIEDRRLGKSSPPMMWYEGLGSVPVTSSTTQG